MILLKIFYLALFLSIDALLYLRLIKKLDKSGQWLAIVAGIWLIALIIDLPAFHLNLMPFKGFLGLSEMVLALLFMLFLIKLISWGLDRFMTDNWREGLNSIIFNVSTGFFVFFFCMHLFIIAVGYHE